MTKNLTHMHRRSMQDYSLLFFSSMTRDGSLVFNLRPLITPTTEDRRIIEWNKIWRRATGKAISNRVERTRELQKSKVKTSIIIQVIECNIMMFRNWERTKQLGQANQKNDKTQNKKISRIPLLACKTYWINPKTTERNKNLIHYICMEGISLLPFSIKKQQTSFIRIHIVLVN